MTVEKRLRPRKTPQQERSTATRARILDAAGEVFAEDGYAGGTTNRIAARAGLSVGSLYQYFPNKDSILVALVDAHIDDGTRAMADAFGDGTDDIELLVRRVVTALVAVHGRDRRLHQVLFEESPRPPSLLARLHRLEDDVVARFGALLAAAHPDLPDPALTARVAVTTVESLVHRLVANERPIEIDRVIDEIVRMVTAYLPGAPSGATTA